MNELPGVDEQVAAGYAARVEKEWGRSGFKIRVGINTGHVAAGGYSESSDTMMGLAVILGSAVIAIGMATAERGQVCAN